MRLTRKRAAGVVKPDMTPMIDMTFQLIAFFMVVVNFSEAEQNQRVRLPLSELAKPPEGTLDDTITLHVARDEKTRQTLVIFGAIECTIPQLGPELMREKQVREYGGESAYMTTIIIRADRATKTGEVQEVIKICQDTGYEKFALRAKQEAT